MKVWCILVQPRKARIIGFKMHRYSIYIMEYEICNFIKLIMPECLGVTMEIYYYPV